MHDPRNESKRWFDQAANDLDFASHAANGGFFHQACFAAQQSAEKALKAVYYADGARNVIGHSVAALLARLLNNHPGLAHHTDTAADLDLLYIPTRYPSGLVEGTPYEMFTRAQAERAIAGAKALLEDVRAILTPPVEQNDR